MLTQTDRYIHTNFRQAQEMNYNS